MLSSSFRSDFKKKIEVEKKRLDATVEVASKLVAMLGTDADAEMKIRIVDCITPSLLQLAKCKNVTLALPAPRKTSYNNDKIRFHNESCVRGWGRKPKGFASF